MVGLRAKVLGRLGTQVSPSRSVCSILPIARRLRAGACGLPALRFALSRKGERSSGAPPSPSLAVIEAYAPSEVIIHLEYKEITYLGYALPPSSVLQSVHY